MINFTRMHETFQKAKAKERLVPYSALHYALEKALQRPFRIQQATADEQKSGIDFYVILQDRKIGIDMKVRDNKKRQEADLVVEKSWINCNKTSWLYNSIADYFLFAHVYDDYIRFYMIASEALRDFCAKVPPRRLVKHSDANKTTAILAIYDYADFFAFSNRWREVLVSLPVSSKPSN